jgi:VanZ family protein
VKEVHSVWKLDRILLAIYLVALVGLMMYPFGGPKSGYLGIGIDKWMHFLLFGGLSVFIRWNLQANQYVVVYTIGATLGVAILVEIGQGMVSYRSAELMDILAGLVGSAIGAVIMNQIVSSLAPEKPIGLMVGTLGLMVGCLFALADVIGVGTSDIFGTLQIAGTALGVFIMVGGVWLYVKGLRRAARR